MSLRRAHAWALIAALAPAACATTGSIGRSAAVTGPFEAIATSEAPTVAASGYGTVAPAPAESVLDASLDDLDHALEAILRHDASVIDWRPREAWLDTARANGGSIRCVDRALRRCTYSPRQCRDGCENFSRWLVRVPPPRGTVERNPDVVRDIVQRQRPRLHRCYARALLDDPTSAGVVDVALVIDPSGVMASASIETTSVSVTLSECVRSTLAVLDLAPIDGAPPLLIHLPFRFERTVGGSEPDTTRYSTSFTHRGLALGSHE